MSVKRALEAVVEKGLLPVSAVMSVVILALIGLFIFVRGLPAFREIGIVEMLFSGTWRPGIMEYGILSMIIGSGLVTAGAIILGVPLSLGCAIFLAEVAPTRVSALVRPCIELLAGIPSVVYGLFGMVVIVPLVRGMGVAGNIGFGLLTASFVLAVMILPTVTSISEAALRTVPDSYRKGAIALGATRWETITGISISAARSGIVSAIILGIGRALGETIAMIMVIGNSVGIPTPLTDNPLTIFLRTARTLTGNIAVEISYATGLHADALFATGIVLFIVIMVVNLSARFIMSRGISQ